MECTECKYRKQLSIKRCKHFELGGDKKRKVSERLGIAIVLQTLPSKILNFIILFSGTNDSILNVLKSLVN